MFVGCTKTTQKTNQGHDIKKWEKNYNVYNPLKNKVGKLNVCL